MSVAELLKKRKEALALKNLEEGQVYCKNVLEQEGIEMTEEGIIFSVSVLGSGKMPSVEDKVMLHYQGTTIHGEVFESSIDRGKAVIFTISKLIKAYQIMIPKFPEGTKFKMIVPPEFAYKEEHINKFIEPNSTLIFDIEIMKVIE